jgi:hypothetical protein
MMKIAISCMAVGLSLLLAAPASAAPYKKKRPSATYDRPLAAGESGRRNPMAENGYHGYYERVQDRVPFGSELWWRVYNSFPRGG